MCPRVTAAGMVLFCAASYALRLFLRRTVGGGDGSGGGSVDVAATGAAGRSTVVRVRVWFYLLVSACTLAYLHGSSTVFVVALALGNYAIGAAAGCYQWRWPTSGEQCGGACGTQGPRLTHGSQPPPHARPATRADITIAVGPLATWAYCIGVLFMNEWYHDHMTFGGLGLRSAAWLDRYRGVYRWHLGFNLVMLRMVSFNMDRYWQLRWHAQGHAAAKRRDEGGATTSAAASVPIAVATATRSQGGTDGSTTGAATQSVGAYMSYRWRQHTHAPASDYNVAHYLAYLFYVPLYLAGPTITFNAWASQVSPWQTRSGGGRCVPSSHRSLAHVSPRRHRCVCRNARYRDWASCGTQSGGWWRRVRWRCGCTTSPCTLPAAHRCSGSTAGRRTCSSPSRGSWSTRCGSSS